MTGEKLNRIDLEMIVKRTEKKSLIDLRIIEVLKTKIKNTHLREGLRYPKGHHGKKMTSALTRLLPPGWRNIQHIMIILVHVEIERIGESGRHQVIEIIVVDGTLAQTPHGTGSMIVIEI